MQEQPTIRDEAEATATIDAQALAAAQAAVARLRLPFTGKTRCGYTTNKGHGTPKAKRRQAAASRHRNRGK
ncbi:MAG: hypothetical protein E6Q97_14390 [Desulfurellales bacterium]|nr:MAG: hypothetical protein E6Q97_14390 [Desulfurellales bacterium]